MPTDENLIPDPILDDRSEAARIAARLHRSIGNLSVDDADMIIDYGEQLKDMLETSGAVSVPLLPELSSARPAEAHTVLLTEIERTFSETLFRFNLIPDKTRIALLRQLGIELRPAVAATTTLQFTKTDDFLNIAVLIPAGTEVATEDRRIRVATNADFTIPAGTLTGTVQATCTEEGDIGRIPPGSVGLLLQSVAGIASVTNTTNLTGGANAETSEQGKIRAREEMRIGEHLGSAADFEDYIYFEILRRKGRVTAFEQFLSNFSKSELGYLLLVIQGADGLSPTQALLDTVSAVVNQRHVGGLLVSVRGPEFKAFNLSVEVTIASGSSATTLTNKAKDNLTKFYDPLRFAYGPLFPDRFISLSDIVGQIEAAGPNLISVKTSNNRFAVTITIGGVQFQQDIALGIGELPALGTVALNVVP
jgi:phage-related baseplate assembly protein